jgi:hypothetical protein
MPTLLVANEICAKSAKRVLLGASLVRCVVSDALSVDIRESYKKERYKHSNDLIEVNDLTTERSSGRAMGPIH